MEPDMLGNMEMVKPTGHGAFMFPNGKKYVGKLKDDLPHGLGTYTHLDGRQYVGEYKDGFKIWARNFHMARWS